MLYLSCYSIKLQSIEYVGYDKEGRDRERLKKKETERGRRSKRQKKKEVEEERGRGRKRQEKKEVGEERGRGRKRGIVLKQ